ncbi:MAG TPA: glycoside hydrolase family 43 protein [Abditibacteriaceae bacterium]|jgi:GH43 family beta-xylosidase
MSSFLSYRNPVWDGYCADPFVLRHEGVYYAYGTGSDAGNTVGGRHFVLLRSPNLVDWECLDGAIEPTAELRDADHWAPEVAFANGKFWMYYSAAVGDAGDDAQQRLRVAVADSPEGPFHDTGHLLFPDEGFTIDASPFRDPRDGQWYLFFSKDYFEGRVGTGTAVVALADDMVTPIGSPRPVIVASADWHISKRDKDLYGRIWEQWHTVEGAHVVLRDGTYYCFYSGGAWINETYGVSYATASHPLGPWTDHHSAEGPTVLKGTSQIIGPGHNSITVAPDGETLVCVYHAWDEAHTARRLCIDPIEWTADGPRVTPTAGDGRLPL